jgi:hypothetical protein
LLALQLPPRSFSIDDISAIIRAFARMAPRSLARSSAVDSLGTGVDGELLRRFSREVRHAEFQEMEARQAMTLLTALAAGGVRGKSGAAGGEGEKKEKVKAFMSIVRVISRFFRAQPMGTLSPSEWAVVLTAFASMRVHDGALFRYASSNILALPAAFFSAMDVSNLVNAYSRVGVWDEPVFRHLSSAARQLRPINVQEAAVICEAFSCAETRQGSRIKDGALFRHISTNLRLPDARAGSELASGPLASQTWAADSGGAAGAAARGVSVPRDSRGRRHTSRVLAALLNAYVLAPARTHPPPAS